MRASMMAACGLLVAALRAPAAVIDVAPDGSGDFATIQAAIDAAASGDEIVLSDGTFTGPGNWDLDLGTKELVIHSVNGYDATKIDCGFDYIHDIEHRAFILEGGQTSATRIEGITLQMANGERDGGFIRCVGVSPIIRGIQVLGAHTSGRGGAIFIHGGSPIIEDCVFGGTHDYPIAEGGAIYSEQAWLSLQRCSFTSVHSFGGAVSLDGGTVVDCAFDHCLGWGDNQGDCIGVRSGQVSILTNTFRHTFGTCVRSAAEQLLLGGCRFEDNLGDDPGVIARGHVTIRNSVFLRNSSGMSSSAVLFLGTSLSPRPNTLSLDHCVFAGDSRDAVVVHGSASFDVTHCTFAANGEAGGWTYGPGSSIQLWGSPRVTIDHTIIAFGAGSAVAVICHDIPASLHVTCSDFFGNPGGDWAGCATGMGGADGNLSADPLFCGVATDDFSLQANSPCAAANSGECGLIGALEVGCGPTALTERTWGSIKALYR